MNQQEKRRAALAEYGRGTPRCGHRGCGVPTSPGRFSCGNHDSDKPKPNVRKSAPQGTQAAIAADPQFRIGNRGWSALLSHEEAAKHLESILEHEKVEFPLGVALDALEQAPGYSGRPYNVLRRPARMGDKAGGARFIEVNVIAVEGAVVAT